MAIVVAPYDRLILDGRKRVECRLTKSPNPPFGCIKPGERVYFKKSSGPFFAAAIVDRVWMTDSLTPDGVENLRKKLNGEIHGTAEYFESRRNARYGTLVWLRDVRPTTTHPRYKPQNMRAWYTLPDEADPVRVAREQPGGDSFDVKLTAGAIRQRSVRLNGCLHRFPPDSLGGKTRSEAGHAVTLKLRSGPTVATDIVGDKKMIRWRGWGGWFECRGVRAGDSLRFTPDGARCFLVEPVGGL